MVTTEHNSREYLLPMCEVRKPNAVKQILFGWSAKHKKLFDLDETDARCSQCPMVPGAK